MAQHFLRFAPPRTLSWVDHCNLSENVAHKVHCGVQWIFPALRFMDRLRVSEDDLVEFAEGIGDWPSVRKFAPEPQK